MSSVSLGVRVFRRDFCLFLMSWSSIAAPATAAEAVLQPYKPWVVDYAATECNAQRSYASPARPVILALRPSPYGNSYEILVATKQPGPRYAEEKKGSVDFGHGPIKPWLLHYGSKDRQFDVHKFRIDTEELNQARTAHAVSLHVNGGPDLTFSLQSMPGLLTGLEQCTADLQHYWNMAPSDLKSIVAPAIGEVRSVFRSSDYPDEALLRQQQGRVTFLLFVDERGSVAGCDIVEPRGIPAFDATGCQVIRERAKFKPAVGPKGQAVRSSVVTPPVVWRIAGW